MKKLLLTIAIIFLIGFTIEAKPANPPAGFGIFFSVLNPHGAWIELDHGLVVWRPTIIRRGWAPYRMGEWVWTSDGWYWDSYEPFGHVTYHYGRWYFDDYYGWIWVPDYEWAPSWVEWRYDDSYIGWAPLPPYAVFSINIGIHYTHTYYTPYNHWHFVTYNHFGNPHIYKHFVGHKYKNRIYNRTKYRTNYDYYDGRVVNRGVDVDYVRKRSGREIRSRDIERTRDYTFTERGRNERDNKIRTLYIPREELKKNNDFNRSDIKRSDRKSSLDISRVELGDRRDLTGEDRKRESVSDDRRIRNEQESGLRERKEIRTENNTKPDRKIEEPKREIRTETPKREERTETPKREIRTESPKKEVRSEIPKREVRTEIPKREVKVETRNEERNNDNRPVIRENKEVRTNTNRTEVQRKVEEKREPVIQNTPKRNEEVKRNETRVQQNNTEKREVRTETRTERKKENTVERNSPGNERNKPDKRR
jgi:hypothetical protein